MYRIQIRAILDMIVQTKQLHFHGSPGLHPKPDTAHSSLTDNPASSAL
jgi:hypothetical protein